MDGRGGGSLADRQPPLPPGEVGERSEPGEGQPRAFSPAEPTNAAFAARRIFLARLRDVDADPSLIATLAAAFDGRVDPELADLLDGLRLSTDERDSAALTPAILGELHETRQAGRKRAGRWYTPQPVAAAMVDWALDACLAAHPNEDPNELLRRVTVLDPACGTGIFLLAAHQAIAARLGPGHEPAEIAARLHGLDTDPLAIDIARRRIGWASGGEPALTVGDALHDIPDERRFDLVVTNPPYLSTKHGFGRERRAELRARYRTAVGQFDAYALFVELGLRHLRPGGGFAYLVPKPILTNASMAPARELLAAECLRVVADPGEIFKAAVEPAVIAGNLGPPAPEVDVQEVWGTTLRLPRRQVISAAGIWSLRAVANGSSATLGDWFTIARGIECGKRDPAILARPVPGALPLLRGGDVTPEGIAAPAAWLVRDDADRRHKSAALFEGPKLLVRRVGDRLIAAVDSTDAQVLNTLYILRPRPGCPWSADALAEWLNQPATTAVFRQLYGDPEKRFPYLRQSQLAALPLPAEHGEPLCNHGAEGCVGAVSPSTARPPGGEHPVAERDGESGLRPRDDGG